jgi:hypothetical protein
VVEGNIAVKTTLGEFKTFKARGFEMYGFPSCEAELDIQPYEGADIEVFLTGSAQALLRIQAGLSEWKASVVIERRYGAVKEQAYGLDASKESAFIRVRVPKGTSVNLWDFYGRATIGDVEGSVHINVGKGHVSVGEVTHASLRIRMRGDIEVKKATGSLAAELMGFGAINIKEGYATSFHARIDGAGEIRFDGEAITSTLRIDGAGEIYVAKVRNPPTEKKISGLGFISIGNYRVGPSLLAPSREPGWYSES